MELTDLLYEKHDRRFEEKNSLFFKDENELNFNNKLFHYRVTFKRNLNMMFTLATNSEEDFKNLVEALKANCICSNFKDDFTVVKIIGKGNFAKVLLTTDLKEINNNFNFNFI